MVDEKHLGAGARFGRLGQSGYAQTRNVARVVFHRHAEHEHVARKAPGFVFDEGCFDVLCQNEPGHLGFGGDAARVVFVGLQVRFDGAFLLLRERLGVFAGLTQEPLGLDFLGRHRHCRVQINLVERHKRQGQVVQFGDLIDGCAVQGTDGNLCARRGGGLELIDDRAVRAGSHQEDPNRML